MKKLLLILTLALMGCPSVEFKENWKNPDIVLFNADKVLIIGMTDDEDARIAFETKFVKEFEKRNVEAMRSIDIFDVDFTNSEKTETELDTFEKRLLDKGFDAVLLTKITGSESKNNIVRPVAELYYSIDGFKEDYRRHQGVYYDEYYYQNNIVYNSETSLYCICVDKERSLIWQGNIDIFDTDIKKTIDDYVKLVVLVLEEQDLIFRKKDRDESVGL